MSTFKMKNNKSSNGQIRAESLFKRSLVIIGAAMVVLVLGIFLTLVIESIPSIKSLGLKYLWGTTWDPVNNVYGAAPFLLGTVLTSFLALIISILFLCHCCLFGRVQS